MPASGARVAATSESGASRAHAAAETARPMSLTAHPVPAKRGSTVWVALVGGVAVGAVAAVLAFKLRGGDANERRAAAAPPIAAATAAPPANPGEWKNVDSRPHPADDRPAAAPAANDAPAAATAAGHAGTPSAHGGATPASGGSKSALAGKGQAGHAAEAPDPPAEAPAPAPPPPPAAPAPVAEAPSKADSLEAMMKRAVRAESSKAGPAPGIVTAAAAPEAAPASNPNLPAKPAMGAVMGAVGAVMPAARYCLGPDDPVSRATITFKSDGSVENVAIAGDAAGQPAEACIRARLIEAKVPPFSSPRFTWTVPVRPAN